MTVDTKTAPKRDLSFRSLDDVAADLDRIEAAAQAGTLSTTGNWTPAENLDHTSRFMEMSMDGFPEGKPPLVMRAIVGLFKGMILKQAMGGKPSPAGIKLPKGAEYLMPRADATLEEGVARVRAIIGRVKSGEEFSQASPLFGKLTHEQWVGIHCGHCAMHWSFLQPGA